MSLPPFAAFIANANSDKRLAADMAAALAMPLGAYLQHVYEQSASLVSPAQPPSALGQINQLWPAVGMFLDAAKVPSSALSQTEYDRSVAWLNNANASEQPITSAWLTSVAEATKVVLYASHGAAGFKSAKDLGLTGDSSDKGSLDDLDLPDLPDMGTGSGQTLDDWDTFLAQVCATDPADLGVQPPPSAPPVQPTNPPGTSPLHVPPGMTSSETITWARASIAVSHQLVRNAAARYQAQLRRTRDRQCSKSRSRSITTRSP